MEVVSAAHDRGRRVNTLPHQNRGIRQLLQILQQLIIARRKEKEIDMLIERLIEMLDEIQGVW